MRAKRRDPGYFVEKFKPPKIDTSQDEFLACIIHSNKGQLRSLRRVLDGSTFYVKGVSSPERLIGHYVMVTKMKRVHE